MTEVARLKWRDCEERKGCCEVRKRERVLLALKRGRVSLADWPVGFEKGKGFVFVCNSEFKLLLGKTKTLYLNLVEFYF